MNEEWGLPISKNKIVDRRNRLIEYRNTREIRTIPLSRVIDENILSINYMIYEIERLNNIINELEKYSENMIVDYNEAIEEAVDNIDRFNLLGARSSYREISNKIKELKGSDKE